LSEQTQESTESGRRLKFQYGILTDVGRKREENQDSHGHAHTAKASVFIVADGMGGAKGGATASAIAVDTILKSIFTEGGDVTEQSVKQALAAANEIIFEQSQDSDDLTGMGTTAVVLSFTGETVLIGHVGDSRAYLLRDGNLTRLTRDHTLVQELVDSGAIQPAEAKNHPIAHMLTRSLGPTGGVEIDVVTYGEKVKLEDTFMLCCDGLYNLVTDPEIQAILGSADLEDAAKKLVNLALERGGTDNITVEIVRAKGLDDNGVDFTVPEPGKLRFVASREAPPLKGPKDNDTTQVLPAVDVPKPTEKLGKKAKRKAALDSVIFQEHTADEPEEAETKKEPRPEPTAEELAAETAELDEIERERAEFDKLKLIGLSVLCLAVGILSYLFLVRPEGRKVMNAKAPVAVPTLAQTAAPVVPVPTVIPTVDPLLPPGTPTVAAFGTAEPGSKEDLVDQLVAASSNLPPTIATLAPVEPTAVPSLVPSPGVVVQPTSVAVEPVENLVPEVGIEVQPTNVLQMDLSQDEKHALASAQSLAVPQQPRLKTDYLADEGVEPIDFNKEKEEKPTPAATVLSSAEKAEIAAKKAGLREELIELDVKLSALDSANGRELTSRANAVGTQVRALEKLLDRVEEALRNGLAASMQWQERKKYISQGNAARLAQELGALDPLVEEARKKLEKIQSEHQAVLEEWNRNRQDPELVSKTASLGRQMKVEKTRLEIAIQESVDRGMAQNSESLVQAKLTKRQVERMLQKLNRQLGFLKAAEPNVGGRNAPRLKDLLKERRDTEKQLQELNVLLPENEERQVLEAQLRIQ